jgi:hypothetical protein
MALSPFALKTDHYPKYGYELESEFADELTALAVYAQKISSAPPASPEPDVSESQVNLATPAHQQEIADSLTAVIHQLRKHQASHQSWLDHFKVDPNHTCGRCTPDVLAGVGDAVEQEVTVKVYDGLIERIRAAQTALRGIPLPAPPATP